MPCAAAGWVAEVVADIGFGRGGGEATVAALVSPLPLLQQAAGVEESMLGSSGLEGVHRPAGEADPAGSLRSREAGEDERCRNDEARRRTALLT